MENVMSRREYPYEQKQMFGYKAEDRPSKTLYIQDIGAKIGAVVGSYQRKAESLPKCAISN